MSILRGKKHPGKVGEMRSILALLPDRYKVDLEHEPEKEDDNNIANMYRKLCPRLGYDADQVSKVLSKQTRQVESGIDGSTLVIYDDTETKHTPYEIHCGSCEKCTTANYVHIFKYGKHGAPNVCLCRGREGPCPLKVPKDDETP